MANYYASSAVSSGGTGTIGDPWPLATALANGSQTSGDTLYLRGGTYTGRFISTLAGGTVCPYPDEIAKIDGFLATTLTNTINSSATTFDIGSTASMYASAVLTIDSEDMQLGIVVDSNTVTVNRGWNGTTATSHTAGTAVYFKEAFILNIAGSDNTIYRGLEIFNSNTLRDETVNWGASAIGTGIVANGSANGNSFINNIIHDCGSGMFIGSSTSNTYIYGNVIYNNGIIALDGNEAGMGIYSENVSGYSRIYNNILVNNWNFNGQFYGVTGPYVGGDHRRNIWANAGSFAGTTARNFNCLAGPNSVASPTLNVQDSHFFQPQNAVGGVAAYMGYGAGITDLTFNNNYIVGGPHGLELNAVGTLTGSGNNFFLNNNTIDYVEIFYYPSVPTGTFNNNTYHKATGRNYFGKNGTGYFQFATWQSDTGFDASSTQNSSNLADTVVVIPNTEHIGYANIAIYAASGATSINVDLATTGLTDNQSYTIKNAFNYFGSNVATGTYDAGSTIISVTLNTAAATVATPTGSATTPTTTAPDFVALIVVPGAADVSAPGVPTGLTAVVKQSNSTTGTFQLAWTLGSGTETSVTVRRIVNGVTTDIPLAADVTSYTDTGQTVGLSYTYAVKASNAAGDSAWSDTAQEVLTGCTFFGAPPSIG